MEMQMQRFDVSHLFHSLPENLYSSPFYNKTTVKKQSIEELLPETLYTSPISQKTPPLAKSTLENSLIKSIIRDDKSQLIHQAKQITALHLSSSDGGESEPFDRSMVSKLLHLCCEFDSVNSAEALINGEINGVVPLINEVDNTSGLAPLHTAAENHAHRCIELLVRKRGRTDLKTKTKAGNGSGNEGGSGVKKRLLPLELALRSSRMEVNWEIDQPLDDLLSKLSDKELGAIRVLSEKTKDTAEVAYTLAMEGRVEALAALLMVAAEKVNGSVLEVRTNTDLAPEKTSVYSCVIREAVSIYIGSHGKHRIAHESHKGREDNVEERRKYLLKEIELLHFFGASANSGCLDKKATAPLIFASQAGDEAVVKLLLQTGINVGDADAEGNSALHWCLKASKVSSAEHIRILCLLLKHGARVRQKDKLGLTTVHIAAANGNLEALKILLTHDPESVLVTSELKETPLFFAAKNDHIECAQLLLTCGATTEVLNLRRERPIDLAKSQDMRSALNRTSVIITNRISQQKYTACMHSDQVVSETCETLIKEPCSSSESVSSSGDEVCKYFGSATGCARGNSCFYRHVEDDLCAPKSRVGNARSTVLAEFKLKIFVGGLPPAMDSDSLADVMEELFGPVADANVLKMQNDEQSMSRGFGFVTFKNEKSVAAALDAHYINVWGKKVEMKSAVPKWLLFQDDHADEPQKGTVQQESNQYPTQPQSQNEQSSREEDIPEKMSWADRVGQMRPDDPVNEPKVCRVRTTGKDVPPWFSTFKKWLPQFLRKMLRNSEGEYYSLSSLKSDFKSIFGLELDHASLGYSKLSDFVKSMPELCKVKIVHTGGQVANHMVLLPKAVRPPPLVVPPKGILMSRQPTPVSVKGDIVSDRENTGLGRKESDSDAPSEKASASHPNAAPVTEAIGKKESLNTKPEVHFDCSRFLQFLEPDPVFLGRTWLGTGGFKAPDEQFRRKHLVLESLAQKKKQVFFLRGPTFYEEYSASLKEGNCFACEKKKMLWANYPCQHMLWCGDCKFVAMSIAPIGTSAHKCVVCDEVVENIDLIPWTQRQIQSFEDKEFPSIHAAYLRCQRLQA